MAAFVRPIRVCILAALALALTGGPSRAAGYLHASGTRIVEGNNQVILLRGVNLGNWLFNEAYMTGAPFEQDTWPGGLKDVLGTDSNVAAFYAAWRSNYVTQADIVRIKALGFNSVRVPFDFRVFYDETTGQPTDDGFLYLDNLLNWCAAAGLYAIPDMHGAPGGQRDPGTFFFDAAKQTIASNIWRRIATRYATNQWLGGYDLVNEPFLNTQAEKWRVRDAYVHLTAGIREVDPNHLIFAEGNYYGADLYDLDPRWDSNMSFSIHNYWTPVPSTGVFSIDSQVSLANTANVPLWVAEFGENSNPWNNAEKRSVEGYGVGWAVWPYKICGESMKCVQSTAFTAGYQAVLDYWRGTGVKPTQTAAYTALLDMAQRTALPYCAENKDFVDALLRPDFATANIPFVLNTMPGRIYGVDYDMGNQGVAYSDVVYQTTNQSGTAWNNGWLYRNDGVDIGSILDNGTKYYVGWIDSNEWLSFTVVGSAGRPSLNIRYSSPNGARIHIDVDGHDITGSLALAATGGWFNWVTTNVMATTNLTSGVHTMKVFFETDSLNFYWLEFNGLPPLRPGEWIDADIGAPWRFGFSLWNANTATWTVTGGGTDIFGSSDQGHFLSRPFSSDGTVVARVATLQNTDPQAKGGVMFRDSSAANTPYAYVFVTPNGVRFDCRTNTDAAAFTVGSSTSRTAKWVKLMRSGNSFRGYFSTNGINWQQLGSAVTIPLATTTQAGLAVTARNNSALATATFDNVSLTPAMTTLLVSEGSSWKYNDSGLNLGTAWRGVAYDDSSWPSGPAQLGFGDGDEFSLIASNRQITTYFRRTFAVSDPSVFTNGIVRLLRDDGAIVYLNDVEIFRSNIGAGAVNYQTPALTSVPPRDETTNFYSTNFNATLLVPGLNVIAVEVHQNAVTSTDLSFDLSLEGRFGPPLLSITCEAGSISLHWPNVGAFTPYSSPTLLPPVNWSPLPPGGTVSNESWTVTLPLPSAAQFYRLQSP